MFEDEHEPEHGREFFDEPRIWSLEKLKILENYIVPWGAKLGKISRDLRYVDAFAGRGAYLDRTSTPGSPVRAAEAAKRLAANGRTLRCLVIEQDAATYQSLLGVMQPYGSTVEVQRGTLDEHRQRVMTFCGDRPALIFLDPFGTKGIEFDIVRDVMSRQARSRYINTDLIINFSVPGVRRRLGMASREETWAEKNVQGLADVVDSSRFLEAHERGIRGEQLMEIVLKEYLEKLRTKFDALAYAFPMRRRHAGPIQFYLIIVARHPDAPVLFSDECYKSARRLHLVSEPRSARSSEIANHMNRVWDDRVTKRADGALPLMITARVAGGPRTLEQLVLATIDEHGLGAFGRKHVAGAVRQLIKDGRLLRDDPKRKHGQTDSRGLQDDDRFRAS